MVLIAPRQLLQRAEFFMKTNTVTSNRIHKFGEFDLMKAIAVLGLPIVHLLEEGIYNNYVSPEVHKLEAFIVALCTRVFLLKVHISNVATPFVCLSLKESPTKFTR